MAPYDLSRPFLILRCGGGGCLLRVKEHPLQFGEVALGHTAYPWLSL